MKWRFIPAPAGNAPCGRACQWQMPVHPRACGERLLVLVPDVIGAGSSPRLRGTRCARRPKKAVGAVHPRACGERKNKEQYLFRKAGSSPRLRGTRSHHPRPPTRGRFIPAPAGNAHRRVLRQGEEPVHPRACGERVMAGLLAGRRGRFIPAPAGNALPCISRIARNTVHPRACGERKQGRPSSSARLGSSPRLRGTRNQHLLVLGCGRFIPAPAGNAR